MKKMVSRKSSSCFKFLFLVLFFDSAPVLGLRYDFGDGTFYVGNVDNDGKPSGRGQFYNSSGVLGENFVS